MKFYPPLECGKLVRRYKRFLADVETADGSILTIHCPNTGSMKNCLAPGQSVWYSDSGNPKRKYRHTWEIATTPDGDLAGVNTGRANALVEEAIVQGRVPSLLGFESLRREVPYGSRGSRADFLVSLNQQSIFVEVKSVTLREGDQGYFPDSVSERASKHLAELQRVVESGGRAMLIYCVQHTGIDSVAAAKHIDPNYAAALKAAVDAGVEVTAFRVSLSAEEVSIVGSLPVKLE